MVENTKIRARRCGWHHSGTWVSVGWILQSAGAFKVIKRWVIVPRKSLAWLFRKNDRLSQIHFHIPFNIVEHNGILLSQTELNFQQTKLNIHVCISVLGSRNQDQSTVHFSGELATVTTSRVLVPGVNLGVLLVNFGRTSVVWSL